MRELSVPHDDGRAAFVTQLDRVAALGHGLSDRELLGRSRCWGWAVVDVVVHLRTGLQEMLGGLVSATDERPDTDAASYWAAAPSVAGDADAVDGVLWTRRTASAYRRPTGATAHLADVAAGVRRAARDLADGAVAFQGRVLTTGDFLATWAVELAVHHLDMLVDLPFAPPAGAALRLSRLTVETHLGLEVDRDIDDVRVTLLGAGRELPTGSEAARLGPAAARLPVLG